MYRAQLQREKQAREDAERRERELHDRLQCFQDEAKAAQEGIYVTAYFFIYYYNNMYFRTSSFCVTFLALQRT